MMSKEDLSGQLHLQATIGGEADYSYREPHVRNVADVFFALCAKSLYLTTGKTSIACVAMSSEDLQRQYLKCPVALH
jgi:hypothetical protein